MMTNSVNNTQNSRAQFRTVCESYRKAYMNCLYYEQRLKIVKCQSQIADYLIALSSCSAIAAWNILKVPAGANVWSLILGLGALAAALKPTWHFSEQIERLSKQRNGYNDLYFDLQIIIHNIQSEGGISEHSWQMHQASYERFKKLGQSDDVKYSKKLLLKLQDEVDERIPAASFCYPEKT